MNKKHTSICIAWFHKWWVLVVIKRLIVGHYGPGLPNRKCKIAEKITVKITGMLAMGMDKCKPPNPLIDLLKHKLIYSAQTVPVCHGHKI